MPERTHPAKTQVASQHTPKSWPSLTKAAHRSDVPRVVRAGIQSGGQSLDRKTQAEMSARFGHDFSQVRIHTDSRAEESAQAMGANAYAMGSDIVFGGGHYTPGSPDTERLLAHELTHVVQQARGGPGDGGRVSRREDPSEREAELFALQVMSGASVQVQSAPQAALARDEDDKGGFFGGLASGAGSLLKSGWEGTKTVAGAGYDGYEKMTDFKTLQSGSKDPKVAEAAKGHWYESLATGGLNGGIDAVEKKAAASNQMMVDQSKGHWYEGLAKADAWVNNGLTQATGGLTKGVLDLGLGLASGIAHPIDALGGMESILEHNTILPPGMGTMLKAGHGAIDLLSGKKDAEYGNSWGQLADHVFNPMTQMKDDVKFNKNLVTGIIAPDKNKDGTTDWSAWKDKPVEAAVRAATNIAPIALGVGEAVAGADAGEVANAARVVEPPSPVSPKAVTVEMPAAPAVDPISPKATTVDMPAQPVPIGDPSVNPFGKTDIPAPPVVEAPAGPVQTRNPVQQMTAVDPAQAGGPQPPGFQSGPVSAEALGPPTERMPNPEAVAKYEHANPYPGDHIPGDFLKDAQRGAWALKYPLPVPEPLPPGISPGASSVPNPGATQAAVDADYAAKAANPLQHFPYEGPAPDMAAMQKAYADGVPYEYQGSRVGEAP